MVDKTRITRDEALAYHLEPSPGKIDISASTPMATQRDPEPRLFARRGRPLRGDRGEPRNRL